MCLISLFMINTVRSISRKKFRNQFMRLKLLMTINNTITNDVYILFLDKQLPHNNIIIKSFDLVSFQFINYFYTT